MLIISARLSNNHTNQPITSVALLPVHLPFCYLDLIRDFESCMRSITQTGRQLGNEAIGIRDNNYHSESEEAAASFASMLGTPI